MIRTPYSFEANFSSEEFETFGKFAVRWSHIEHTIANCLRVLLRFDPKQASVMIYPLSLDTRMSRITEHIKLRPLEANQLTLFEELKPLIRAMQYLRNTVFHGTLVDLFSADEPFWHLRSKDRTITKSQFFACEDLVNYTAHITEAFRLSLGDKADDRGSNYALPGRPPIPDFLPDECRVFPKVARVTP
jgi:hypothetical protein